jgi:hypothetical protein
MDDWRTHTQHTDDGHLLWTGMLRRGVPSLYHGSRHHRSASVVIYTEHHQRPPHGPVTNTCRIKHCVQPEHLVDYNDRQRIYRQYAEEQGMATTDGYCDRGHPWADSAVFEARGHRFCGACANGEPPVVNEIGISLVLAGCPEVLSRRDRQEAVRHLICRAGKTHEQVAPLVGVSPRTVTRWAVRHGWRKPVNA